MWAKERADEETAWAATFAAGRVMDPAIPPATGERVALRVPDAVVAVVWPVLDLKIERVLSRGPVVVTDRRVLSLGGPPFERAWGPEVRAIVPEHNGCGAIVYPTDDAFRAGVRPWAVLSPVVLARKRPRRDATIPRILMWNRVAAAWRASQGELDEWAREMVANLRGDS